MPKIKPRIIYFQENPAIGAAEEYLYLLAEGVDKGQFAVSCICPKDAVMDPWVKRLEAIGVVVYRYLSGVNHASLIWRLRKLFLSLKPDLVHFNDPCLHGIIAARLAGLDLTVMMHHTPELTRRYNLKGWIMERIAFQICKPYFIFSSEFDQDTGIKKDRLPRERSCVIYFGFPPEKFQHSYSRDQIYAEFSLDQDSRIIGNIGRLAVQKGQKYLIEVAPLIIKKFKSVKFFLVGEGELEAELKALVRENGLQDYFIFTGYRDDVLRLLSAFEILVMPSFFEGLSFAVLEATALGIPIIATNVGGVRRSVIEGKTGLLIPPSDPGALAEAIIWMLEHPQQAKEMGRAGQVYFRGLFTQSRMAQETELLYKKLLHI